MKRFRKAHPFARASCTAVVALLYIVSAASGSAQNAARPAPVSHRAVAITQSGEAVLREDGRVISFPNSAKAGPVLIEGLTDIEDISGVASGLGPTAPAAGGFWIALRRNGDVFQWSGTCAKENFMDCRYARAVKVKGLRNIVAIHSNRGTHLALDRDGAVWGWGDDYHGLLTGAPALIPSKMVPIALPIRIPVPVPLRWVAVGAPHAIGIDHSGGLWIWGRTDKPDAEPEQSQTVVAGQMTFRKVEGLPPARTAAVLAKSYVVTEKGELWSWGIASHNKHPSFGTRQPQRIEGICLSKSVSVATGVAAVVCLDGAVYQALWPGGRAPGQPECFRCTVRVITEEKWERVPYLGEINHLHLSNSAFDWALIDQSGAAYRGALGYPESFLKPLTRLDGPLGLSR